jgi:hypothetical protein
VVHAVGVVGLTAFSHDFKHVRRQGFCVVDMILFWCSGLMDSQGLTLDVVGLTAFSHDFKQMGGCGFSCVALQLC